MQRSLAKRAQSPTGDGSHLDGAASAKRAIFTIGHSNRTFDELLEVLRAHGIAVLVDIRTLRRSRANPQFNANVLGPALARAGIRYEELAALGGLRRKVDAQGAPPNSAWEHSSFRNYADYAMSEPFRDGLGALMRMGAHEPTAIMCAEALWWRCHRRIVADHLLARGVPVVHLFSKTHAEPASLTPFAVVERDGPIVTYPKPKRRARLAETQSQPRRANARRERRRKPTRAKTNHR